MAQQLPLADQVAVVRSTEGLFYESTHEDLILALIITAPGLSPAHRQRLRAALNRLSLLDSALLRSNRLSASQGGGSGVPNRVLAGLIATLTGRFPPPSGPHTLAGPIAHNTSQGVP